MTPGTRTASRIAAARREALTPEVIRLYRQTHNLTFIARDLGISWELVRRVLREAGEIQKPEPKQHVQKRDVRGRFIRQMERLERKGVPVHAAINHALTGWVDHYYPRMPR